MGVGAEFLFPDQIGNKSFRFFQVDYLQQRTRELEAQVAELKDREFEANSRRLDLDAKTKALENELEGMPELVFRVDFAEL